MYVNIPSTMILYSAPRIFFKGSEGSSISKTGGANPQIGSTNGLIGQNVFQSLQKTRKKVLMCER